MTLMSVIVAFLFAISLWYLSSNHKVTFVKLKATDLKFLPNRSWHRLIPAGGTFVSAMRGTIDSAVPGTFESDTGGTFNQLLSGISNIHIFGHSLGEVDLPYFHKVFSIVDRTKITVEISDHNNENRATIANFMRTESISEEQYSIVNLNDLLIRNQ